MLLVALWIIGLLSLAVGSLAVRSTHETRLGRIPAQALQRDALAQAAIQRGIALILEDDAGGPRVDHLGELWATGIHPEDGQVLADVNAGPGAFSIGGRDPATGLLAPGLVDEARKLNLRTAQSQHVERLIELVHPDADGSAIAQALADWQDPDEEDPTCEELAVPCHNGPLESVDELRLVPGVTPELMAALEPYVTVYGSATVNANTASVVVLQAMEYDGEALEAQRSAHPFDGATPPPPGLGIASEVFTIPAEAMVTGAAGTARLKAVIDRQACAAPLADAARCILAWVRSEGG